MRDYGMCLGVSAHGVRAYFCGLGGLQLGTLLVNLSVSCSDGTLSVVSVDHCVSLLGLASPNVADSVA